MTISQKTKKHCIMCQKHGACPRLIIWMTVSRTRQERIWQACQVLQDRHKANPFTQLTEHLKSLRTVSRKVQRSILVRASITVVEKFWQWIGSWVQWYQEKNSNLKSKWIALDIYTLTGPIRTTNTLLAINFSKNLNTFFAEKKFCDTGSCESWPT